MQLPGEWSNQADPRRWHGFDLLRLPDDLLDSTLRFVELADVAAVCQTCTRYRRLLPQRVRSVPHAIVRRDQYDETGQTKFVMKLVATFPNLIFVKALRFRALLHADAVRLLCNHLPRLRTLDLSGCQVTPTMVATLTDSRILPELTTLTLRHCEIAAPGLARMLRKCRSLRQLDLRGAVRVRRSKGKKGWKVLTEEDSLPREVCAALPKRLQYEGPRVPHQTKIDVSAIEGEEHTAWYEHAPARLDKLYMLRKSRDSVSSVRILSTYTSDEMHPNEDDESTLCCTVEIQTGAGRFVVDFDTLWQCSKLAEKMWHCRLGAALSHRPISFVLDRLNTSTGLGDQYTSVQRVYLDGVDDYHDYPIHPGNTAQLNDVAAADAADVSLY